jgi:hypothetical protein
MLTFPTLDALIVTALFLVPGYIWSTVHASLMPRRATETQVRIIEFLALSCLNHAVWFWLFGLLFATAFSKVHPGWAGLFLIVPGIVSPFALGLLSGKLYQADWPRRTLGRYGFRTLHQVPTAWDYQFSRLTPYWVIATLKDGSRVYGLFGYHSFASDDPRERDLYLEATFTLREDGEWLPVEGSAGILIRGEQIAALSFRRYEDGTHGDT